MKVALGMGMLGTSHLHHAGPLMFSPALDEAYKRPQPFVSPLWAVLPRLYLFNLVLAMLGSFTLGHTDLSLSSPALLPGPLYYFIWTQCAVHCGMLNLVLMARLRRRGWGHGLDAVAAQIEEGSSTTGSVLTLGRMAAIGLLNCLVLSWITYQVFLTIQASSWGLGHLSQVRPTYISTLSLQFYGMLASLLFEYACERIAQQRRLVLEAQKLSAQAQLDLLRSQLDPHLLFNTLSNLHALIDEHPDRARSMLLHLIGFLRSTLVGSRRIEQSLGKEFMVISDYLSLMQIRMGDRLKVTLSLPDSLSDTMVPALLLQPLVENAIKHGLELRKAGGLISVSVRRQAEEILLEVSNSSEGTPARKPARPDNDADSGFGLRCVRERLEALYGHKAGVEMRHCPQAKLTCVTIRLPLNATTACA